MASTVKNGIDRLRKGNQLPRRHVKTLWLLLLGWMGCESIARYRDLTPSPLSIVSSLLLLPLVGKSKVSQGHISTFILFPGLHLGISAENECHQLHCTLRDLTTMERALGRLSEHFIGEVNFANRFSDGEAIVERLGQIALFGTQSQLFTVHTAVPTVLQPDLVEV